MSLLICIPTLSGREQYLVNAIRGYAERTDYPWHLSLVRDAESCGVGWNRCAEHGLRHYPGVEYIHFSNDDVVPARDWLWPLIEAVQKNSMPAPRIEPAGGHIREKIFQTHPPMPPDFPLGRDRMAYFYADLPENQPTEDWQEIDHGNLPFCSVAQWWDLGPFIPCHYNTDTWLYHQAKRRGIPVVARPGSVFFNYNANIGRSKGDWTEQDFLDFDGIFAFPAYENGTLAPHQQHPLRLTDEGLRMVREWRKEHVEAGG